MYFFKPIIEQYEQTREAVDGLYTFIDELRGWIRNNTEFFQAAFGTKKHLSLKPNFQREIETWKHALNKAAKELRHMRFGKDIEGSILDNDAEHSKEFIDWLTLIERSVEDIKDDSDFLKPKKAFVIKILECANSVVQNSDDLEADLRELEELWKAQKELSLAA